MGTAAAALDKARTTTGVSTCVYRLWIPPSLVDDRDAAMLLWGDTVDRRGFDVVTVPVIDVVEGGSTREAYVVGTVTPRR